jgi:hypothetical protein
MDSAIVKAAEAERDLAGGRGWNLGLLLCVASCVAFWAVVALLVVSA